GRLRRRRRGGHGRRETLYRRLFTQLSQRLITPYPSPTAATPGGTPTAFLPAEAGTTGAADCDQHRGLLHSSVSVSLHSSPSPSSTTCPRPRSPRGLPAPEPAPAALSAGTCTSWPFTRFSA